MQNHRKNLLFLKDAMDAQLYQRFSKKYRDHLVYMSKDNMCFCSVNTPLYNIMNATLTTQKNLFDIRICYLSVHPTMNLLAPPRF